MRICGKIYCDKRLPRGWRLLRLYDHANLRAHTLLRRSHYDSESYNKMCVRAGRIRMVILGELE